MNELVWYVYQNGQQMGPFEAQQIKQMIDNHMIAQDGYLFKVGWKDWRPLEEAYQEYWGDGNQPEAADEERRAMAPRATIKGRIVVHNDGQITIGSGVNISATGLFVETRDEIFRVGESLKLSVKVEGFSRAFNAVAQVIRFNSDARHPVGYGLRFEDLDDNIVREIQQAVDAANQDRSPISLVR